MHLFLFPLTKQLLEKVNKKTVSTHFLMLYTYPNGYKISQCKKLLKHRLYYTCIKFTLRTHTHNVFQFLEFYFQFFMVINFRT